MLLTQLDDNGCSHSVFRVCSDTSCPKTHVPTVDCQCVPTTACPKKRCSHNASRFCSSGSTFENQVPIVVLESASNTALQKNCCSHSVLCMCSCTICSKTRVPTMVFQYATTIVCHTPQTPSDKQHASNKQCFETKSKHQAVSNTDIHNH